MAASSRWISRSLSEPKLVSPIASPAAKPIASAAVTRRGIGRSVSSGRMPTTTADALSDAARSFVTAGPHRLLIGADWVGAADGRTFETIDPATGETICEVAHAGAEDVDRAVRAAAAALEGPWSTMPAAGRGRLMYKLADLIEQNAEELAQ